MRRLNSHNFTTHNEVADWYDAKFKEMGGSWAVPSEEIDGMLDLLGATRENAARDKYLLDLGCGDGKVMHRAHIRGYSVSGVDISTYAVNMAKTLGRQAKDDYWLIHTDEDNPYCVVPSWSVWQKPMEGTGFQSNSFDFVFSYGSMEHAISIGDAIAEMYRILKPEGKFLIYAPNEYWTHEDQPLETTACIDEWTWWLETSGFAVDLVEIRGDNNLYIGTKLP